MDTKGSPKFPVSTLATTPLKEGFLYVAIKGSLHATDCSVFGLDEEEIKGIAKKYDPVINGFSVRENALQVLNSFSKFGYKIISSTAFNGDIERVRNLIDKARNAREIANLPDNSGYTALHYAARNGHINICKILLQNGACVNAQTRSGNATPLHKAAAAGKVAAVKFLIDAGATVDLQDVDGQTALHKAVENKKLELVDVLLEACPELLNIKDSKGKCPAISE